MGILCTQLIAQNDIDAIRYTNKKFGSTAKSMSIGGAVGSLGADVSSASVNPAGLAQYKKGEFSFSVGFVNTKNTSTYLGNSLSDNAFKMNIPNFGLVFANKTLSKKDERGWKNYAFAVNMARVADFNRVMNFEGTNTQTSLMDYFAERANGLTVNQLRASDDDFDNGFMDKTIMAWEGYLIDSVGDRKYSANASPIFHDINQKGVMQQSGGMNEFNFSMAVERRREVDRIASRDHRRLKLLQHFIDVLRSLHTHLAIGGIADHVFEQRGFVLPAIATHIRFRHHCHHLLRRRFGEPAERAHHGVGDCLRGVGVLLDEISIDVNTRRQIVATIYILHALFGAAIGNSDIFACGLQLTDDRIKIGHTINLALFHRGDGPRARPGTDNGDIGRFQAILGEQVVDEHIGR